MKKIKYFLASLILAGTMTGCSEDYMQVGPEKSVAEDIIFDTPKTAQYAVNGLSRIWYSIKYFDDQALFGLPAVFFWNGDFAGDAMQIMNYTGYVRTASGQYNTANSQKNMRFPWLLFYKVIGNANMILSKIPEDAGSEQAEWDHIKAQALVFRAYSYQMLSNFYCRRWSDRDGESRGLVLRLEPSNDERRPCSLKQLYEQIYADLDEAIRLFGETGKKRSYLWLPDASVAHAVYCRAALFRYDWQTVIDHAQAARKGYELMGADEYMKGFSVPNKEWIWEVFEDETQASGFASFYGYVSPANSTSFLRSRVPQIDKSLVNQIDPADSRLPIYIIPTTSELSEKSAAKLTNSGKVTKGDFFNRVKADYVPERVSNDVPICYYMATKFIKTGGTADGEFVIFRAAEMYYNEIEALIRLDRETDAQKLLEDVVKPYNADYTCTKTGDDLWKEYVAYRKFDLWGEGHNWPDLKRWGVALERKGWTEGGSWHPTFVNANYGPTENNNWTICYPLLETQYNRFTATLEKDDWKLGDN